MAFNARQNYNRTFGGPSTAPKPKKTKIEDTTRDRDEGNLLRPDAPPGMDADTVAALFAAAGTPGPVPTISDVTGGDDNQGVTGSGPEGFDFGQGQTETPFGNTILPGAYGEAWSNPDALIRAWFRDQNMGIRGGSYAQALDQADNLGILWLLMQNQEGPQDYANFIDWTGGYLGEQFTPGGASPGYEELLGAMFNDDPNNPMRNYLANPGLSAADQVGNFGSTFNTAMENTLPDIVRAAMLARIRELGDDFQSLRLTQPGSTPFTHYAQGRGFGL